MKLVGRRRGGGNKDPTSDIMTINVRLFASLREVIGKSQITLHLSSNDGTSETITIGDLMKKIADAYPAIRSQIATVAISIAINGKIANHKSILKDSDEVALLPPVSGG
jgi:MoaD family protein